MYPGDNVSQSTSSYPIEDEGSMRTADECLDERVPKKCKGRKKKPSRPILKSNRAMTQNKTFGGNTPCKEIFTNKNIRKKKIKKTKKLKKKLCKKESYICDRCKSQDPCEMSFDRDPCDAVNELLRPVPAPIPSKSRNQSIRETDRVRKQQEPKELDLLLHILGSVDTVDADINFERMIYKHGNEENADVRKKADYELQKKLREIYCLLKYQKQMCTPCDVTVSPVNICSKNFPPCNSWEGIVQKFQQAFCCPVNPCCCRGCKKTSCKSISRRSCPPCSKICSRARCQSCCCVKCQPCCPPKSCASGRRTSKRSLRDDDLKFKSRMWLLDTNERLERKLSKLRSQEEKKACCCCCCDPTPYESHYSFMLWQMLMQSLVKALVESHPAVKQKDNVCQCRLQCLKLS